MSSTDLGLCRSTATEIPQEPPWIDAAGFLDCGLIRFAEAKAMVRVDNVPSGVAELPDAADLADMVVGVAGGLSLLSSAAL